MKTTRAVILAAGEGTRRKSSLPKVLHPILGKPMLWYPVQAARRATQAPPVLVLGYQAEQVRAALDGDLEVAIQSERLGTGHAVMQAEALLRGAADQVLVINGDLPLLTAETLSGLVTAQKNNPGPLTMLTVLADSARGFGRILRSGGGQVLGIIEEAQATPEQLAIRELNVGVYCFAADWLWEALRQILLSPKGEYYLTDLVGIAVNQKLNVQALTISSQREVIGINTRAHLAEAAGALQQRINQEWMLAGVTLIDPAATYIEPEVTIGQETVIWPNTHLQGATVIGEGCEIGPNSVVRSSRIGNGCTVFASIVESAVLEDHVDIGPFAHLRKGAYLAEGVHMGNFGEVKNSYLGPGSKMGHFSYIGDAAIGSDVNIGAGTITCNYDGERKHKTEIEDGVFLGSDTMLVAPVKLGRGARTGAGAVVTKDVPADSLAVGVPAKVIRKIEKSD